KAKPAPRLSAWIEVRRRQCATGCLWGKELARMARDDDVIRRIQPKVRQRRAAKRDARKPSSLERCSEFAGGVALCLPGPFDHHLGDSVLSRDYHNQSAISGQTLTKGSECRLKLLGWQ